MAWLTCFVECREGQYVAGLDEVRPAEELHQACLEQCQSLKGDQWPTLLDMTLGPPADNGTFWGRMSFCLNPDE